MKLQSAAYDSSTRSINRRDFLAGTGATLGLTLLSPKPTFGAEAVPTVNLGLIGCGGRGKWIANLFHKHGGYRLVAVADYFQDRADSVGEAAGVPAKQRFIGLSGYQRLLEQKLDAVVIQSPPYFHPEQAAAAVTAGKHVYLAKPVAVDVPGSQSIAASGTKATQNKLCFLVDYQMPTLPLFQDAVAQIKKGELGTIVSAEASYQTGLVGEAADRARRADRTSPELRLRAWVTDRALSGDVITEQNVHAIDMACRLLDAAPLRAYGTGGKKRDFVGDCWDHFSVIFEFPNPLVTLSPLPASPLTIDPSGEGGGGGRGSNSTVITTFSSKQVGFGYDDIMCRIFGTNGMADLHYAGQSLIKSREYGNAVTAPNLYTTGTEANISAFHEAIAKRDFANPTVAPGVRTNLTAILGRTAAYRHTTVTWDEMLRANESLATDLRGLKS